jgi:uncharacterized protein YigA (DUF484 family)
MQAQLAMMAAKFLIGYLRKHPEFLDEIAKLIPGQVDDWVLRLLKKALSG